MRRVRQVGVLNRTKRGGGEAGGDGGGTGSAAAAAAEHVEKAKEERALAMSRGRAGVPDTACFPYCVESEPGTEAVCITRAGERCGGWWYAVRRRLGCCSRVCSRCSIESPAASE